MKWLIEFFSKFFRKNAGQKTDYSGFVEFKPDGTGTANPMKTGKDEKPFQKESHANSIQKVSTEIEEKEDAKELNKSFVELSDKFTNVLKEKFEIELGYKKEDLQKLDAFITENEKFFQKELTAEKKKLLPLMYAYVGEVVRRNNKGSWKKPSAKQSAVEITSNGETKLVYPGTLIKQRIEKNISLAELVGKN